MKEKKKKFQNVRVFQLHLGDISSSKYLEMQ